MLRLFQSNKMTALVDTLIHRQAGVTRGPFEPVSIVVQSLGMGQWLKLKFAEDQGIAANMDCVLPADFVWQLYRAFLNERDLPDTSPFDRASLTWRLMRILPDKHGAEYRQIRQYLQGPGDHQLRLYQLCEQIAGLFDQYLMYRPQWMLDWTKGENPVRQDAMRGQAWQMDLWQTLLEQPDLPASQHRAQLHDALRAQLQARTDVPASVPGQLSVFGLSSLPPMHLDTFRLLGQLIDVDIYFLNPCEHYWGDIVSRKDVARRAVSQLRTIRQLRDKDGPLEDEDYLEIGNPLLSSMGKQGREFLEMLLSTDEVVSEEAFVPSDSGTMLGYLKNDILHLEFGGQFSPDSPPQPQPVRTNDRSIQVHSCHNKMREVEILYDHLHCIFAENDDIKPRDVMVMAPNVADYVPYIHAVFKDALPYSIADRVTGESSPVLASFSKLLDLPHSRLTATEVIDLLEVPAIARCFRLSDDDLTTLTERIDEAGIRFEFDGASKQEYWDLPASGQNTWSFGLRRLMAGYAIESRQGLYQSILPVDIEGDEARPIGILHHFVPLLAGYRRALSGAMPAHEWLDTINAMITDMYAPDGEEELDLHAIRDALQSLVDLTAGTGFTESVSPNVFRHWMTEHIAESGHGGTLLSGGVTFATLVPMRSIPFDVICLLGMNDGAYPRQSPALDFDLIQLEGESKGDRSRRNDDRYLFLEALLSANRYFYLSYEGRSLKDNSEKVPSVLVNELAEYCQTVFDTDCRTEHKLQPFSEDYFNPDKPELFTWRKEWYRALTNREPGHGFVPEALPTLKVMTSIDVNELTDFYRHPARYFMRQRLGVFFDEDEIELKESESFSLDALERYQLADSALKHMIDGCSQDEWRRLIAASGAVMDNPVGNQQLDAELANARAIFDQIADYLEQDQSVIETTIAVDGIEISGRVDSVYNDTLLNYRTGKLRQRQLLQAWVRHCFLNASGRRIQTRLISANKPRTLPALPVHGAEEILACLIGYYHLGMSKPLPFIPEMSFIYAAQIAQGKSAALARKAALNSWFGSHAGSEASDPNYQRCFDFPDALDEQFHEAAIRIAGPVLEALNQ